MGTRLYWKSYREQHPYSDYLQFPEYLGARYVRWSELTRTVFGAERTVQLMNLSPGGIGFIVQNDSLPPRTYLQVAITLPGGKLVHGIYQVRRSDPLANQRHEVGAGLVEADREEFGALITFLQQQTPPAAPPAR